MSLDITYSDMTDHLASIVKSSPGTEHRCTAHRPQLTAPWFMERSSQPWAREPESQAWDHRHGGVFGRTVSDFAGEAIALALEDAGLQARDLDGLLINGNQSEEMAPSLQFALGLFDLTLVNTMSAFGSSAATMLQYAAHAIESGQANVVACVYADAPLAAGESISQSVPSGKRFNAPGLAGLGLPTATTGPPTRCTRWRFGDTCICSGPTTTNSGRLRSGSASGR